MDNNEYSPDKETTENIICEISDYFKEKLKEPQRVHWKNTDYGKEISVEKLVAEFNLNSVQIFPYTHCKARVWYRSDDEYVAHPNIGIIDMTNEYTEIWSYGKGSTIEESLNNLIRNLIESISRYEDKFGRKLTDEDYCYSKPHDF